MPEPIDLTGKVLEQIRDELRGLRSDVTGFRGEMTGLRGEMTGLRGDVNGLRSDMAVQGQRMELVETTLRDLAEQVVMMTRGLKLAIESRARDDARLEDHERRLSRLESAIQG